MMNKKIEAHINAIFENVQNNNRTLEVKEELLANLNEKYDDLIKSGKSEEEAFALVISSIGDIDNLLKDMGVSADYKPLHSNKKQIIRGVFVSLGIALYVISIIPIIALTLILPEFGISSNLAESLGLLSMIVIASVATGFVIFGNIIGKTDYVKSNNSFVEEYKEKLAVNNDRTKLKNAITSSLWSLIIIVYLAFSFLTSLWHISWIIFLMGACLQQFIEYIYSTAEKRKNIWHGILWTTTTILYFVISFSTGWTWSWMIFLLAIALQQIIRLTILMKKSKEV